MTGVKVEFPYLSEEQDRHGNPRLYVRRYGRRIRLRLAPGAPGFGEAYDVALRGLGERRSEPAASGPGLEAQPWPKATLGWLAVKYFGSEEFRALNPRSQRVRRGVIESCLSEPHSEDDKDPMGNCPLAFLTSKKVKRLRDLKAGLPGAANNRKKYLSAMFGWAIEDDHMKANPARDVRRKKYATKGFYTWTLSDLIAFENRYPIGTKARLALGLLLFLGVRRGDLVRLGPAMVTTKTQLDPSTGAMTISKVIKFIPNKTRHKRLDESVKPILPALDALIAASPTGTRTFLETEYGEPFTDNGFGMWFRDRCDDAGLPMCTAHGLRKIGATLCAENGATEHQLMALFDWTTPSQAAVYTRAASRSRLALGAAQLMGAGGGVH